MTQQVAQRDVLGQVGIRQLEVRQVFCDGVIPAQPPFRDQQAHGRGQERLRAGSQREGGVLGHFAVRAQFTDAVAACEDHLVILDDRDGEPGDFPFLHGRADVRV
jgi:hypothetical protein